MIKIEFNQVSVQYRLLRHADYNLKGSAFRALSRRRRERIVIDALRDVSMEIRAGTRIGVCGPNGAGKTTLLRVAAGALVPTAGQVKVAGKRLSLLGDSAASLNLEESGRDNLYELGVIYGLRPSRVSSLIAMMEEVAGLGNRILDPVYTYSAGMQTRLKLAVILQLSPDVLILDEGIATADRDFFLSHGGQLRRMIVDTPIVIVASHSVQFLAEHCNAGLFLDNGRVQYRGEISDTISAYYTKHDSF